MPEAIKAFPRIFLFCSFLLVIQVLELFVGSTSQDQYWVPDKNLLVKLGPRDLCRPGTPR